MNGMNMLMHQVQHFNIKQNKAYACFSHSWTSSEGKAYSTKETLYVYEEHRLS
jgi:hypothetical protein